MTTELVERLRHPPADLYASGGCSESCEVYEMI